jgi:hypothetical protein
MKNPKWISLILEKSFGASGGWKNDQRKYVPGGRNEKAYYNFGFDSRSFSGG